jgi:hypothetical protein
MVSAVAGLSQIGQVKSPPSPLHPAVFSPHLPGAEGNSDKASRFAIHTVRL